MPNIVSQIWFAIKTTLRTREYFVIFFVSAVVLFAFLIALPLFTIPGNTLAFQLIIFTAKDYLLMTFLSLFAGLNLALSWYGFSQNKKVG